MSQDETPETETEQPVETPPEAPPEQPAVDKARKRKSAAEAKKAADKVRHDAAIEAGANVPEMTEAQLSALAEKEKLHAELEKVAAERTEHEDALASLREQTKEILAKLYPGLADNDLHSTAMAGYLKASAAERENRAAQPGRVQEMLKQLGKAPIDAAFSRARARGMGRPKRAHRQRHSTE